MKFNHFRIILNHLFPFGWFFSFGGAFIIWLSIAFFLPILKYNLFLSEGKIVKVNSPRGNEFGEGGENCYNTILVNVPHKGVFGCSESCSEINENDIGKTVKIKFLEIPENRFSIVNKILTVENKKINYYFGQAELIIIVLFLWGGLFLYIAYRDIKNEYKRQLEKEENRKNAPSR